MFLVTVLSTLFLLTYLAMMVWLYPKLKSSNVFGNASTSVSIVVPFRNEEKKLPVLLKCLSVQVYCGPWEVIFINDHSEDKGAQVLQDFFEENELGNFRIMHSPKRQEGKKNALAAGIAEASGDMIVQTDADCKMGKDWLQNLMNGFDENTEMVLGPVAMLPQEGFWSQFAALEFMSLQASGAAFALGKKPIMGSAANMAYRKMVLTDLKTSGKDLSSGDDVFRIQSLAKEDPRKVRFVLNTNVQTTTNAPTTFNEFINQRARWGSKTTAYPSQLAIAVAALIGGLSAMLVVLVILSFWNVAFIQTLVVLLFAKAIADYSFLSKYAQLTQQANLLRLFIPSTVIYPFYICITGVAMLFKTTWKGRAIQK